MKKPCLESVIGTWFIDGPPGGEEGILVVTPERRVVQFFSSVTRQNKPMRVWGWDDVNDHIRLRPSPSPEAEGWLRRIVITDSGWTIIATHEGEEYRFHCRAAAAELLPPWFAEELERNLLLMAGVEARYQTEINR